MKTRIFFLSAFVLFCAAGHGHAYWIWTPKTGKWVNPRTAVKPSPQEQFSLARELYEAKSFTDAEREFRKLLKGYPKSFEASESQYYIGRIEEERGNLYRAYKAYQTVIEKYPFSERIQEIVDREYRIAERFAGGRRTKDVPLSVENPAAEIFTTVVENSSYGARAPGAQYQLGMVLKGMKNYYEAEDAFNKVISSYPESEWAASAQFQIAACRAAASRAAAYDQGSTEEARKKFGEFLEEHPDAALSTDAQKNIGELGEKEAESKFEIAAFYEKQKAFDAAKIYYNDILTSYPESAWAAKALERIKVLENKKK